MDRTRADWLHYKAEASLAERLADRDRTAQMQDLFEAYRMFQRTKSQEEVARESQVDWRLNRGRKNPRYVSLLAEANRTGRG